MQSCDVLVIFEQRGSCVPPLVYGLVAVTHVFVWSYLSGVRQCPLLLLGMAGGGGHLAGAPHPLKLCLRTRAPSSMDGEMGCTDGPQTVQLSTTFLALFPFPGGKSAPWPCDLLLTQELCWHHLLPFVPVKRSEVRGIWCSITAMLHPKLLYSKT